MRYRNAGRFQTLASSPTMVGALTVLVAVVAVFLAYNANSGLPFVPVYRLTAQVPNSNSLTENAEVRIGGVRIGVVDKVDPVLGADGQISARLGMKIDRKYSPIATDSTVLVRARSALGLKYVELTPGHSDEHFADGATMPLSAARPEPVELDQLFNTFDEPTRNGTQETERGFGDALAGRGGDLNGAIGELSNLVDSAQPVLHDLGRRQTRFGDFWRALERTSAEAAPVAEQQAQLFVGLDQSFGALARVARPYLQETISRSAPTEDALIADLPSLRPFFGHSAQLFANLEPGTHALAAASSDLAAAVRLGVPALRLTPRFNAQLAPTAQAALDFQGAPGVLNGLDLLTGTNNLLDPPLAYITPSQTVCNYLALLFRNAASVGENGDGYGTWTRAIIFTPPPGPNNESSPASAPANGPDSRNHLHSNPYPATAAPGQLRECEAGNEPYAVGETVIGNTRGNQGTNTEDQKLKKKKTKKGKKKGGNGK